MGDQFGNSDEDLERGDYLLEQQRDRVMMADADDRARLLRALKALNDAAYAAVRAGRDTTLFPSLDRQALREICAMSDKLVEDQ